MGKKRRPSCSPALQKLPILKLIALFKQHMREFGHKPAKKYLLEGPPCGVVKPDMGALAQAKQVQQEIERRVERAELGGLAAKNLKSSFRRLPATAMVDDLLKRVSPLPVPIPPTRAVEPHSKPEEQPKPTDATPAVSSGEFCNRVIDEIRRIRHLCVGTGRSIAEIQSEHPDFAVWNVRESLGQEDRETFNHPNQWGPSVGYAKTILAKSSGCSEHTITARVKAYRKSVKPKKP